MDGKYLVKGQVVGKLYPITLEGFESDESSLDTIDASPVDESHWDKLQALRCANLYANIFVFEDGQLGSTKLMLLHVPLIQVIAHL